MVHKKPPHAKRKRWRKLMKGRILEVVGASGFEPPTSWSRTRHLNPINALSGVAYGTRSVISPLLVVPKLYLPAAATCPAPFYSHGFSQVFLNLLLRASVPE